MTFDQFIAKATQLLAVVPAWEFAKWMYGRIVAPSPILATLEIVYADDEKAGAQTRELSKYIFLTVQNNTSKAISIDWLVLEKEFWHRYLTRRRRNPPPKMTGRQIFVVPPDSRRLMKFVYIEDNFVSLEQRYFGVATEDGSRYWVSRRQFREVQKEYKRDFPNSTTIGENRRKVSLKDYTRPPIVTDGKSEKHTSSLPQSKNPCPKNKNQNHSST